MNKVITPLILSFARYARYVEPTSRHLSLDGMDYLILPGIGNSR
ncbi:MAG: hypothetical protein RLZZ245_2526 [Verrucomicrobiota bacterium]